MRFLADRLCRDVRVATQREMDPASLQRRHRLELEHLAAIADALGGTGCDLAQLPLAPAAIVLDVDEHARPRSELAREHQVDEMLKGRQPLAFAADEGAQRLLVRFAATHVELARIARLDAD